MYVTRSLLSLHVSNSSSASLTVSVSSYRFTFSSISPSHPACHISSHSHTSVFCQLCAPHLLKLKDKVGKAGRPVTAEPNEDAKKKAMKIENDAGVGWELVERMNRRSGGDI